MISLKFLYNFLNISNKIIIINNNPKFPPLIPFTNLLGIPKLGNPNVPNHRRT